MIKLLNKKILFKNSNHKLTSIESVEKYLTENGITFKVGSNNYLFINSFRHFVIKLLPQMKR